MSEKNPPTFGKHPFTKISWALFTLMCRIFGIRLMSTGETLGVTIGLCAILFSSGKLIKVFREKIVLGEKSLLLKSGFLTEKTEEIQYKKINNVSTTSFLGIGGIEIFTGNDKPIKFKNLEKFWVVKDFISGKIE